MKLRPAAIGLAIVTLLPGLPRAQGLESLGVSLLPGAISFSLSNNSASNPGNAPIVVVTSWRLTAMRTELALYAYFSSSGAALAHSAAGNTVDIPSARVEVSVNGGPNGPFDQTVAFGAPNAGRQIYLQPITALTLTGSRSDTLSMNINLSGYGLPADTYTGFLRVRASATP